MAFSELIRLSWINIWNSKRNTSSKVSARKTYNRNWALLMATGPPTSNLTAKFTRDCWDQPHTKWSTKSVLYLQIATLDWMSSTREWETLLRLKMLNRSWKIFREPIRTWESVNLDNHLKFVKNQYSVWNLLNDRLLPRLAKPLYS